MTVDIHLCAAEEIDLVSRFLDRYWARDHVLSRDRALIGWQHGRDDGRYNFLVARAAGGDELLGVLGFIPTGRYDATLVHDETVWLALWKVHPTAAPTGLGLALLRALTTMFSSATVGVVGIGPKEHAAMYRALGFQVGELTQYYMLNGATEDFRLASVIRDHAAPILSGQCELSELSQSDLADASNDLRGDANREATPLKTHEYFRSRYFGHPTYTYTVYRVEASTGAGILATRIARHGDATALRIVDFLGPEALIGQLGGAAQSLLRSTGAEYADFWNAGISAAWFERAGFRALRPDEESIVPNYFEPFVQRNARIAYAIRPRSQRRLAIFRADGDQDRPNVSASKASQ